MIISKCEHRWSNWNFCGTKRVMQVRGCHKCSATQTRRATHLDIPLVAEYLSKAWRRYAELFGEPPRGTRQQMEALLELAKTDEWGSIQNRKSAIR